MNTRSRSEMMDTGKMCNFTTSLRNASASVLVIDHSVVESFGAGGKTNILSRVYPTLAVREKAHLFAFNNGTEQITV
ncbi:beta-fructofuranosidase insoluble isoenzyme 1-like, partial [Trifolium medium]|nr:beta-fructofuranosidase insoluble isoenzyme 1-like [Trifolium medium]